jgi:hypothetical protein
MSIAWLLPAALGGVALIALPIAIHLLVRQHARTTMFPSLRFLRETQLAASRRRSIRDAALLGCRAAVIALAALALAGPVLRTPTRDAAHAQRVSRVAVSVDQRTSVADALADAVRELDRQPASAREIVIRGVLRRGAIDASSIATVPRDIGIRFEPAAAGSPTPRAWSVLVRRDGTLKRVDRTVELGSDSTRVTEGVTTAVPADLVAIVAEASDTTLAEAALRASLDAGVPWSDFSQRVVVVWSGADESQVNRAGAGSRIIRMPAPPGAAGAADAVRAALAPDSLAAGLIEPALIEPAQLAAWSRPPGSPSANAPLADEGDRRWLWALALGFLSLEWWLRRASPARTQASATATEARVA